MKKVSILLIALLFAISFCANSQDLNYIYYTVDGKDYKAEGEQLISYIQFNNDYNVEGKRASKAISANVSGIYGLLYTIELDIHIDTNKNYEPGTLGLAENTCFLKKVPIASLRAVKHVGGEKKFEFFESEANAKGFITITKVDGYWIEGIFDGDAIPILMSHQSLPLQCLQA